MIAIKSTCTQEVTNKIIHDLCKSIDERISLLMKRRSTVKESYGWLEILHSTCLAHTNNSIEFDLLYFACGSEYPTPECNESSDIVQNKDGQISNVVVDGTIAKEVGTSSEMAPKKIGAEK